MATASKAELLNRLIAADLVFDEVSAILADEGLSDEEKVEALQALVLDESQEDEEEAE